MKTIAIIALSLLPALLVAAEIPLAPEPVTVPIGQSVEFRIGTVPTGDTTVLLNLLARLDSPGLGGSMYYMEVEVNGVRMLPAKSRTVCRLVGKSLNSPVTPGLDSPWYGVGGWRVLYSPDFEAGRKQAFYEGDPYSTVLDVTDAIDPLLGNVIKITNTAPKAMADRLKLPMDLVIGAAKLDLQPGTSPTMAAAQGLEHVINRGEPGAGPAEYQGTLHPGGGFSVKLGDLNLNFETAISYPNAGLNKLAATDTPATDGQPGWQVSASGDTVTASGPDYTLRRRVRFTPRKVEVSDETTNRHGDRKLGLLVRHAVDLGGTQNPLVRLAGNADPAVNDYYAPANPSVHIGLAEAGLGLICEDDVFRAQARLFFDPEQVTAGLRTEMLCLGPGESHTLSWSVYPVASRDYYDFINLVRQDWGSNYTVEGAWCFFSPDQILDMPAEKLRESLTRLGVNFACSWGGWVDPKHDRKRIGFGTGVMEDYWADYRDRLKKAANKLREAKPGIKVILYYDTQRDTRADASTLYADSRLTDAAGVHQSTEWGGQYSLTWNMFASLDNAFGKAVLEVVDAYMDEIGADGLYWDEMENVAYGYPYLTYSRPDGRSCILDLQTYTPKVEVGLTTLLGEGHRLAVIDRVREKGGTLMGNGPTTTRALLGRKVQRMVEIQHNDWWCYEGNLDSPLGYGSSRRDFGNVTRALKMATLLVGTALDYPHEFSRYTFPFTPIELHHGYLLGQERIITLHSGRYGWPGETVAATLHLFGADGKLVSSEDVTVGGGDARLPVELSEGQVAVIERR